MKSPRTLTAAIFVLACVQTGALLVSRISKAHTPAAVEVRAEASFFPVAVWYGGGKVRAPMLERIDSTSADRWGKDLDAIKADGFNTVKTWVDWATAEPGAGRYNFSNLDLLLRLAEARGLRVIVQVYLDSAPNWVGQQYPEARFVDRSGAVIDSQSAPGYCIDYDGVRTAVVKFLEALSRDANRSPALYGWDVWSEPHIVNWAEFPYLKDPEFCFCRYTQARFRKWLLRKYQTLDRLNAAWYRSFETWDQVEPPRFPTILSYTDYLDWRAFIDDKLAEDLKTRVDAIRSVDTSHPITSHAAAPALFTSPTDGYGEPDDWKMTENADFFGTSLYPKHSESTKPWSYTSLAAALDFSRSAGHSFGKGFWIGELQAGQGATGTRIADPVTAQDERYWMWETVAHGTKEIGVYAWYPMSSGFESNGYGLVKLDGTITERAKAAGRVARAIDHHAGELLGSAPAQAQIGILYNRLSYMVGGSEPSLSKLGNAERDSLLGLHRAFFERNLPVDFIFAEDVARNHVGQYKILFLPYPVMLSQDVANGIERYIKLGGTAVAEARLAWNDARGFASDEIPGAGLAEVFGARERIIRPLDRVEIRTEASAELPDLQGNTILNGEVFEEELEPAAGASVLGRFADGSPAIVEKSEGKGKAILIGSFLGLSYEDHHEKAVQDFLLALAKRAGVSSGVRVSGAGTSEVEVRRLDGRGQETVFVFNHADRAAEINLSVHFPWTVRQARDLESDEPVSFEERNAGWTLFHRRLGAGEMWVFRAGGS